MKSKNLAKNIFIDVKLSLNQSVILPAETSNRLKKVMRFKKGWILSVFNGYDGLFSAEIIDGNCQEIRITEQLKEQPQVTQKTLFLPILKKEALSNAIRQATELGIDIIQPILTDFTVEKDIKQERYEKIILGATEQSERLTIPELKAPLTLKEALDNFNHNIFWACERTSEEQTVIFTNADGILIGPEGGFSDSEKELLSNKEGIHSQSLGSNILKADTATVASIVMFNSLLK